MTVCLSDEDYLRLLTGAEGDDMLIWCERCGAWLDRDDPRASTAGEVVGCWFSVTLREQDKDTCVRDQRPGRQVFIAQEHRQ